MYEMEAEGYPGLMTSSCHSTDPRCGPGSERVDLKVQSPDHTSHPDPQVANRPAVLSSLLRGFDKSFSRSPLFSISAAISPRWGLTYNLTRAFP